MFVSFFKESGVDEGLWPHDLCILLHRGILIHRFPNRGGGDLRIVRWLTTFSEDDAEVKGEMGTKIVLFGPQRPAIKWLEVQVCRLRVEAFFFLPPLPRQLPWSVRSLRARGRLVCAVSS